MPNLDFLLDDTKSTELVSRLEPLRKVKGYTQRELSLLVGVTEATIANWERSRSGLDWFERVYKLCSALDCQPQDLFERKTKEGEQSRTNLPSYEELYALYRTIASEIRDNKDPSSPGNTANIEKLDKLLKYMKDRQDDKKVSVSD